MVRTKSTDIAATTTPINATPNLSEYMRYSFFIKTKTYVSPKWRGGNMMTDKRQTRGGTEKTSKSK